MLYTLLIVLITAACVGVPLCAGMWAMDRNMRDDPRD